MFWHTCAPGAHAYGVCIHMLLASSLLRFHFPIFVLVCFFTLEEMHVLSCFSLLSLASPFPSSEFPNKAHVCFHKFHVLYKIFGFYSLHFPFWLLNGRKHYNDIDCHITLLLSLPYYILLKTLLREKCMLNMTEIACKKEKKVILVIHIFFKSPL